MKKIYIWSILTLIITTFLPTTLLAQENASAYDAGSAVAQRETHVTPAQALNVGYTFMRTGVGSKGNGTKSGSVSKQAMQLIYTGQAYDSLTGTTTDCYYVFALQPKGFVIVAADDRVEPILGYSYDNDFVVTNMPTHVRSWLGNYEKQIKEVAKSNLQAEPATQSKWTRLKSGQAMSSAKSGGSVGPLLTTEWGQGWPYNAMCPIDSMAGEGYHYRCPTGCVATAFAQVMNYWKYPEKGRNAYGGIWYNEATYEWDSMDVNHIDEISKLMYHIGVAADMEYGPTASGANTQRAKIQIIDLFEYEYTDEEVRSDHSDDSWIALLDSLLEDSIPVVYGGFTEDLAVGHAWVCDGYDANGFYHMNWGWDGGMNGYFNVHSSLNGYSYYQTINFIYPAHFPLLSRFRYEYDRQYPNIVQFIDQSYNFPDSCYYDFGDGYSSCERNPIHQYSSTGIFTVMHIVFKGNLRDTVFSDLGVYLPSFVWNGDTLSPHDGESRPLVLDYDMDGKQDFIISSTPYDMLIGGPDGWKDYISNPTTIYRNIGSSFEASQLQHASSLPPAVIDIFNENKPSVLLDGLFLRNLNGVLTADSVLTLQAPMKQGERFSVVDYNNDGRMDVMIGDTLYKNIGNGLFKSASCIPFGQTWLDYDKDGDMDLFTNQGIRSSLYKNNGNGTFSIQMVEGNYYLTGQGINGVSGCWFDASDYGDIDGDGRLDILSGIISTFNKGNNRFEPQTFGGEVGADYTLEGECDMIYASGSGVQSYENGEMTINRTLYPNFATYGNTPASLAFIDRDGDNRPDLLATGYCEYEGFYGNSTIVYDNNSNSDNLPPSPPVGLNASVTGNNVILSWQPSTDDHNSVAITYNIAVGTSPTTCDVYSPLSNLETGKRYAYNKGNAGNATLWKVNDLPNGTYYWRVQAIDNALAASAFSTVGTFTINYENLPPAMADFSKAGFVNQPLAFDMEDFTNHYSDPEHDSLQSVKICNMQGDGTLYLAGTSVTNGQIIPATSLASLIFASSQPGVFEITLLPNDGYHFSNDTTHIRINTALFKQSQILEAENISALAWGDFDNDGDADLASNTGIWKNDFGTFVQVYTPTVEASSVQWVDVNNDGLLDCLFDMTICLNQGSGVFSQQPSLATSIGMKTSCMDLNVDNHPDIIISADQTSTVFFNHSNGYSNDSVQTFANNSLIGSIAVGDYNRDGNEDVIMVEDETWNVQFLKNNSGTLINAETQISNYNCGSSDWGDYDRDGDLDFIGTTDNTGLKIYSNDGMGYFYEVFTGQFPIVYGGFVKWYDYDNDGYLDILMGGLGFDDAPVTFLFRNNQGLEFVKVDKINLPVLSNPNCAIGDYDQDGYGDIAISGTDESGEAHIFIYHNKMGSAANPMLQTQSSPQGLTATVSGSTVHLSWDDTIEGNSYNVYVRKATDSFYIVSPLANTQTGERMMAKMGNTGLMKSLDIHSLQEGTYLWSVQSVDASYHGSPFASEQSFEIICAEPIYTDIYDTVHAVRAWHSSYYNSTGIYSRTFESSSGCDSIVRLHLTVDSLEKGIVYVTQSGSGDKSGYSWDNAMDDLQIAINTSVNRNAVVWVAEGIYSNEDGGQAAFVIPSTADVYIYGGFEGSEPADYDLTLRNLRQHETILDGLKKMHVIYKELSIYNTVIDGFTIQNGYGEYGGGIYVNTGYGGSTPMNVLNCIIRDNLCSVYGGGYNGGLGGNPLASATNCLIEHNRAWQGGAAMSVTLYNSTVVYNTADYSESYGNVDGSAYNSIIWGNTPGDGMNFQSFAYNCAIQYALLSNIDENCFYLDANNDGEDTTAFYVRFVDPENGDFRLSTGSACINKGTMDTTGFGLPLVDLQGLPRVLDGRIDMGAYEYYPVPVVETYDTICEGNSVTFYGTEYAVEGIYTVHTNPNPMQDTMYVLHLTINPADSAEFAETACGSYEWNGETFTTSGDYTRTLTNASGCDSVVTLHLTIHFATSAQFADTACGSYEWNGQNYTSSGDYEQTFTAANGCDSIVTLHLTVNQPTTGTDVQTACGSFTWIDGITYTESNSTATYTLTNAIGCDSIVTLNLTIFPADSADFAESACDGFEWNGETFTSSGDYTRTLTNASGCDSVVTLHLTIHFATSAQFADTACGSYEWNGQNYTSSGDYEQTFTAANGCDSVVTLHLTVNQPTTGTDVQTACGSYTWIDGVTYTESNNTATFTLTNAAGCDSVVTLHLTVNQPTTGTDVQTACGSYTWIDGVTYTESNNTATYTLTNAAGCDSVVTLNLIINQPTTGIEVQTACGNYTWIDGVTYTESNNTATYTLTNAAGCDSVVTLNLTINQPTTGTDVQNACGSYTWIDGVTYTESNNTATFTLTNAAGCDSVVTLHLTVNQPTTGTDVQTTCGSYTWIDGVTYTESNNTATYTLTNAVGCDSVVTLNLTVNQPTTGTDVQTACGSYTWIDGVTYTESNNTATYTLMNAVGCDSVVTLSLTINHATHNVETETACESFTWHGTEYTTSGIYTYEYTNASGCASVDTLILTIKFATSAQFADTACDSYEWNGQIYTSSGDYMQTFTNAAGCDSVVTLHLNVNHAEASEFTIETSDSCYIWNAIPYCTSGDYTQTLQTVHGCDSIVTLHLTITVGIDDHNLGVSMTVYPNPTTGMVNVECTMNNGQVVEFQLFDAFGKLLNITNVGVFGTQGVCDTPPQNDTHGSSVQTQIDLSHYAAGIYFVKAVADGNVVAVRKVVKR